MSYIGNIPAEKYQTLQKQSFTTSATDTYTLSYSVTNPQDLALFINNVRQNPNDAYTVSGTTLTLSSAITSSDTMYAVFLGRAVETVAPATGSVTNAMLAGSIATSKLADITANGITMADQFRLSASLTGDGSDGFLTSNLERVDGGGQGTLGTGMTESSGVFTFPSTGIYLVRLFCNAQALDGNETAIHMDINVTTNNSSYTSRARNQQGNRSGNHTNVALSTETLVDVTDTSQVKVKFGYGSLNNNNTLVGDTNQNRTFFTFVRLGDT